MARTHTPLTRAQRDRYNVWQRAYNRTLRATRAQMSLCRDCGRVDVPADAFRCTACRARKRDGLLRRCWVEGKCQACGHPREGTKVHCAACLLKVRVRTRDAGPRQRRPLIQPVRDWQWQYLTGETR